MKQEQQPSDRILYIYMTAFAVVLLISAFLFNSPSEIYHGSIKILTSPANLTTDYFFIANIGATLLNASIMVFQGILLAKLARARIDGLVVAAIFTVAGFSLFGKNLYNSIPIIVGVFAYAKLVRDRFAKHLPVALFGTALGPLVSEVTFGFELELNWGISLGFLTGFLAGFVMPLLAQHFATFHKGFNLYNIGFTAGLIGTFFIAVFRSFGLEVQTVNLVSSGNNLPMSLFLYLQFLIILIVGLKYNGWSFKGYMQLLKESGQGRRDYLVLFDIGLVSINIALLGFLTTTFVLILGGELNGPIIGGIYTVVGFGASGKHIKNVLPIMLGVIFVGYISIHDINSTGVMLAVLFGTTLAPVSGYYGPIVGFITGCIHMLLVTNLAFLHAGMNLYNNGFSGGFVAGFMVPILEKLSQRFPKLIKGQE